MQTYTLTDVRIRHGEVFNRASQPQMVGTKFFTAKLKRLADGEA
jgi:hypothetical protein